MEKTINMVISETKQRVFNILVESNLPIMISSIILHDIINEVDKQCNQVLDMENKQYLESLNKTEPEKEKN